MYEDSQRFSGGDEEVYSHVITIHPSLLVDVGDGRMMHRKDDVEPLESTAFTMQRVVGREARSPLTGGDREIDTPEYTNIREESMQRILSRLSPNGRRAFLQTMSEGEGEARPPAPFTIPESDDERDSNQGIDQRDAGSGIDYLLDSPIPELTTRSLIPISTNEVIQSHISVGADPNVAVRVSKSRVPICLENTEADTLGQFDLPLSSVVG